MTKKKKKVNLNESLALAILRYPEKKIISESCLFIHFLKTKGLYQKIKCLSQ